MSREPLARRAAAPKTRPLNAPPPRSPQKLPLTDFIRRQLVTLAERDRQRSHLVNVLIGALALFVVGTAPGYIGTTSSNLSIGLVVAALLVFAIAFVTNSFFRRPTICAYILVVGGGLVLIAQTIVLAFAHNAQMVAHASLLLPAIILVAGLLFVPEVILITAFCATVSTAFALLLVLALNRPIEPHDAYRMLVYSLGLQLLAGLIAWLLAHFIAETNLETQRAQEMQFSQARLEALTVKTDEDARLLNDNIGALQVTMTRAMTGEYGTRAELREGPLMPMVDSLNLLLQRFETATQAEQRQARIDAAAMPLIDAIARLTESGTPTPASLPIMTDTPLDSVALLLSQMHTALSQRLNRMQRLASEVVDLVKQSADPFEAATSSGQEAQRIAGKLIGDTEIVLQTAQRQLGLLLSMRRMLTRLLPEEITWMPAGDELHRDISALTPEDAANLLGLGRDLGVNAAGNTGLFETLGADDGGHGSNLAPLTRPLPIIGSSNDDEQDASRALPPGELAPELVEVWHLAVQLDDEIARLERTLSQFARDLGVLSRNVRTADANVAWFRTALEGMASSAEQLQQLASAGLPAFGTELGPGGASRPLGQEGPTSRPAGQPGPASRPRPAGPSYARPLGSDERLDESMLADPAQSSPSPVTPSSASPADPIGMTPAPGSLNVADLISFEGVESFLGQPLDPPETEQPRE